MTGRARAAGPVLSESAFQTRVMGAARQLGWRAVHYRPSLRQSGRYTTAVQGDKGGPDLLLARNGRVLLVELKTDIGTCTPEQKRWAEQIGPEVYRLWRPRDWEAVLAELSAA